MSSGNWMEETLPTPRVEGAASHYDIEGGKHGEAEEAGRSELATVPGAAWLLGCGVMLLTLVVGGLWGLYLLRGQMAISGPTPTPIIWTPTPVPTPVVTVVPSPTTTTELVPTVSPEIAIGGYVRVAGTGGYGLNLRAGPGEDYERLDVALEGETFLVVDGPTVYGDSEWWKIRDPEEQERQWWAVGNFLEPVEHP
jgi:hypothetical protein